MEPLFANEDEDEEDDELYRLIIKWINESQNEEKGQNMNGKIYARLPKESDGNGYARIFHDKKEVLVDGTALQVSEGTAILKLSGKDMQLLSGIQRLDIKPCIVEPDRIFWMWTSQQRYKPGDVIKGFIVARERIHAHVMALKPALIKKCTLKLKSADGEVIRAVPIDIEGVVIQFEVSIEDKKYMKTGSYSIELCDPDGKVLGKTNIDISFFSKKEVDISIEAPKWVLKDEPATIIVSARYYHGKVIKSGMVKIKENRGSVHEMQSPLDNDGRAVFETKKLDVGKHTFSIEVTDDASRREKSTVDIVASENPASITLMLPTETMYSTLPVNFKIRLESPDGTATPVAKMMMKWDRIDKMTGDQKPVWKEFLETDADGYIETKKVFENEGCYSLYVSTDVNGKQISIERSFNINRFTQGDIVITNEMERGSHAEGERIKGRVRIHAHPDTIVKIKKGYVDLVTDKIIETIEIPIENGVGSYDLSGIVDFWGTASADFYVNVALSDIQVSSMGSLDKASCLSKKASTVIEPSIPLELKMEIQGPKESRPGKEIFLQVRIDAKMILKDDIHVFGAVVDKRIVTVHDTALLGKTFLKAPKPLDIDVLESTQIQSSILTSLFERRTRGIGSGMEGLMGSSMSSSRSMTMSSSYHSPPGIGPSYMSGPPSFSGMGPIGSAAPMASQRFSGGFGSAPMSMPKMSLPIIERLNFVNSVIIDPVRIGSDGTATIAFSLPDSITSYEVVLFAAGSTQFGQGEHEIVAKNKIFLEVKNAPTIIFGQETIPIKTIVNNESGESIEAIVQPSMLEGISIEECRSAMKSTIGPMSSSVMEWPIKGIKVGEAKATFDMILKDFVERSGLDQPLFVMPPGSPTKELIQSYITASKAMEFEWNVDGKDAFSLGIINILPSLEVAIIEGLESLAGYPYGCMEQTVASTTPNLIVHEYLKAAGKLTPAFAEKLVKNMQSGFERMMGYHNKDGGFSYWGGASTPFYTALGMSLIARMKPYLKNVPENLFKDGISYLNKCRTSDHWEDISSGHGLMAPKMLNSHAITAYIVNSLAIAGFEMEGPFSWLATSVREYNSDPTVMAMVLESWSSVNSYREKYKDLGSTIKRLLEKTAKKDGEVVSWEVGSALTSTVESTARVIIALVSMGTASDANDLIQGGIKHILSRRESKGWNSTTDTLFAAMAISKACEGTGKDFLIRIFLNNVMLREDRVTEDNVQWKVYELRNIYIDQLEVGTNSIRIEMSGPGRCHAVAELLKYKDEGRKDEEISVKSKVPVTVMIGKEMRMEIDVKTSKALESVMIEVRVPSLFKVEDGSIESIKKKMGCTHIQLSGERLSMFFERLEKDSTIIIPLTATMKGECRSDGTVFGMYSGIKTDIPPMIVSVQ